MKLKSLLLFLLTAVLLAATPRSARADDVSFDFFFESLSPYGEWLEVGDYGYCWRPSDVDEDWSPYTDGYWTYTDAGWTWVSYEDFGGIVYHYGRWVKVDDEGWCWVPDYEWGPAWVSWRSSDDYVGWAPLPVEARWERERGISVSVDLGYDIGPSYYNFCRVRDFGAPVIRPVIVRRTENVVIIHKTVNITNITYNTGSDCVFNGGLDYGFVNRHVRRPIPALKLVRNTNVTFVNNTIINNNVRVTNINAVPRGNQLTVIAPRVTRPQPQQVATLVQPKVKKVVSQQKVSKGWGSLTSEQRQSVKAKLAQETKGVDPGAIRAKPLKPADLKVVPVKADPDAKVAGVPTRPARLEGIDGKPRPGVPLRPGATTNLPDSAPGAKIPETTEPKKPGSIAKVPRATPPPKIRDLSQDLPVTKVPPATTADVPNVPPVSRENPVGRKPFKLATPAPETAGVPPRTIPATPVPNRDLRATRPTVVKPFKPATEDGPGAVPKIRATPPPNMNANAARERAAEQAALRQRTMEQSRQQQQQQQELLNRKKESDGEKNRQLLMRQQEQKNATEAAARARAAQVSDARRSALEQQSAAAARARAAQSAETRSRAMEVQQAQAAAARQQAAAARAAQAQQVPPSVRPRPMPQAMPPAAAPRTPVKPGGKRLTPEEAAELKKQQ